MDSNTAIRGLQERISYINSLTGHDKDRLSISDETTALMNQIELYKVGKGRLSLI